MRQIEPNNDYRYDVDLKQLNVNINSTNLFHKKEASSFNSLNKLLNSYVELKSQDNSKNFIWIEYGIIVNNEYKPSGTSTTEAELYRITVGEIVIELPTDYLRWIISKRKELDIPECENKAKDYIGQGVNIPFHLLLHLQKDYRSSDEFRKLNYKRLNNFKNKTI
jgi:hypothetical protein